jgi:CHAT domain-containing protein/tetratricopeptide (TPR) repeat protein
MRGPLLIVSLLAGFMAAASAAAYAASLSATGYADALSSGNAGAMGVDQAITIIDQAGSTAAGAQGLDDAGTPPPAPLSYAPPPRSIDDITAILDQEKPDPAKRAAAIAAADQPPPIGAAPSELAEFYHNRGLAARTLGRDKQYLEDEKQTNFIADEAHLDPDRKVRYMSALVTAYEDAGDLKTAIELQTAWLAVPPTDRAHYLALIHGFNLAMRLGRLDSARDDLQRIKELSGGRNRGKHGSSSRASVSSMGRASVFSMDGEFAAAEGRYADAEADIRRALAMRASSSADIQQDEELNWRRTNDNFHADLALDLMNENRLLEAEAEARIAVLDWLHYYGRDAPETANAIGILNTVLLAEGRFAEAQKLATAAHDILTALGHGSGSVYLAKTLSTLARAESGTGDNETARTTYGELERIVGDNGDLRRTYIDLNLDYAVVVLLRTRNADAMQALQTIVEQLHTELGDKASRTALARGWLGVAYLNAGDKAHAEEQFAAAMPVLLASAPSAASDQNGDTETENTRHTGIIGEAYLSLVAEKPGTAAEAFLLADALRARSVGQALAESAARAALSDPALANLARHEQDAGMQIGALQSMLTNVLTLPSAQQEPGATKKLQDRVAQLQTARAVLRRELNEKSPAYAAYIDPKPATLEDAEKSLRPGEAMVAFYLGANHLFAWAVPYQGAPAFAATPIAYKDIAGMVGTLRHAVDPNAEALDDIPEFDVAQAYKLYQVLLQPVVAGWGNAKTLIVVPHRILGTLPLSLLVTLPVKPILEGPIRFSAYKDVPFLARKVAVVQLPSVGALATLRALPAGAGSHVSFVGFGDPWFNPEQAREASADVELQTRGGVKTAQLHIRGVPIRLRAAPKDGGDVTLAQLPRLPDTAEEVRDIAGVLHADTAKDVFLGAAANVRAVRTMNLADRSVIVFATHGLVPGDLAGLTQPALALSAPDVAHVDGDGLLTVDKILGLKLNADWVVLSACNTAAGAGAGAEAVSGLGRAFFYAGARALLVSNWPVETVSARILTSDLFRRVAANAHLSRAEALRQAELALIDGPGYVDKSSDETLFSYAHPIFWAPFAVVGDGGATIQ